MQQRRTVGSRYRKKKHYKDTNKPPVWFPWQQSASSARLERVCVSTYPQPDPSGSCGFRWPAAALSYRHCGHTHTHARTVSSSGGPLHPLDCQNNRKQRGSFLWLHGRGRAPGAGGGPPDSITNCGCGGFQRGFTVSPSTHTHS